MRSVRPIITYRIALLFITFGICYSATAQSTDQKTGKESTFQISFVPGLSTSGSHSTSQVSFNIIGGYNGAFQGFEAGSVFNGNRYDVSGWQLSGLVNMNKQRANGALFAGGLNLTGHFDGGVNASGLLNINRNEAKGVFLAGSSNYTRQFSKGLMAGGALNISRRETNGVLLAGGMNIAGTQQTGLMMAGGVNLAKEAHGITISPVDIVGNHTGVQIGVINISSRHSGNQIGVINVVGEESEGTSVGLLSFVEGGRLNADIWGSETGFINGGIRLGTDEIYNILSIGYNPFYGDNLWQVGLGIGYHYSFSKKGDGIETDLVNYHLNYGGKWTTETSNHIQWRMHRVRAFTEDVRIFFGPSVNLLITDKGLSASQIPYTIHDHSSGRNQLRWWVGWSLGIELF